MMTSLGVCVVCVMVAVVVAAPLDKAPVASSKVSEVQKQEQELQSLLKIADAKSGSSDVTVHEESVQHVHEVNGHKTEVDTARKTVSDTATGQVLSDVKQEVIKPEESAGATQPEVEVKTEVDVPEEGIHETIVQSGPEASEEVNDEQQDQMEFSPQAVADYLYQTGDFLRFYSALAQLVNSSIMTEEEAEAYSQMVALEYDRLQMEEYENNIVLQRRASQPFERYPVAMEMNNYPVPYPVEDFPVAVDTPEAVYGLQQAPSDVDIDPYDLQQAPSDVDIDPYDLLTALWSEAYGSGNARAQSLVAELFNKVQTDNDPDDEGQVRDILLDLIANTVVNEDSNSELTKPRYGWQPIIEDDVMPQQPARPIKDEDEEAANELEPHSEKRAAEQPTLSADTKLQPMENGHAPNNQPITASETETKDKAAPVSASN